MKLTNFGLIFTIIFICISVSSDINITLTDKVSKEQIQYNNALDNAISDALFMLAESDDGREVAINTDRAVDMFFSSLSINLMGEYSDILKKQLEEYIPVIVFPLNEGVIIYYHNIREQEGILVDEFISTSLIPYRYEMDGYIYDFCLNDKIIVYHNKDEYEGKEKDVKDIYEDSLLADEQYQEIKNQIIIDTITRSLKEYTNKEYVLKGNIEWEFTLPYSDNDMWTRTIKDAGMLVVFVGYPYSDTSMGYYSKFAFGGARIWKEN